MPCEKKSKSVVLQQLPQLPLWAAVPMNDAERQRFLAKCVSWSSRLGDQDARILEQQGVISPRMWFHWSRPNGEPTPPTKHARKRLECTV